MRKSFLCTIVLAAACLLLCAQEAQAQYAYGSSGIGYDPNTKIVYGYSRTSVDYYAGSYYDPYVEGFLLDPYSYRDWGYSRGYMYYYSALVETASYTSPSTRYDVESDHYVISWYSVTVTVCDYYGFYGGCGYDPYGFSNYFGGGLRRVQLLLRRLRRLRAGAHLLPGHDRHLGHHAAARRLRR